MAIGLDGADDRVACANPGIGAAGGQLSIMCWARPLSTGQGRIVSLESFSPYGSTQMLTLELTPTTQKANAVMLSVGEVTPHQASGTTTLSTGTWYHVGLTRNSSALVTYTNGAAEGSTTVSTVASSAPNLNIGCQSTGAWGASGVVFFGGQVADVRIYNRTLSAAEVATLAAGFRGPLGGEVLWLPMDEVDGAVLSSAAATVFDMSGNGNHGTPQGGCLGAASYAPRMNGWIP